MTPARNAASLPVTTAKASRLLLVVALCPACLIRPEGTPLSRNGEPLRVLGVTPADGETGVDLLGSVEIRFSQPLDPASLDRTKVKLSSGSLSWSVDVRYDAIERTIVVDPRSQLRPDLWYDLEMDGFPLSIMGTEYLGEPVSTSFRTGTIATPEPLQPSVSFEEDVWPILQVCACHGQESPYMDFVVLEDTPDGFLAGSVATPSREWPGWLVIDPGHHETSYLVYKLVGDDRLGLPTIMGDSMPPGAPMSMEDIEIVRDWIEMGAGR